ncbi:hypothetical protein RSOLAG1IB_12141 [Rhizoctonia solani AG-1 IB]|uniref:Uncharacterized protein n=1 Tax=Thanatephorus cucumeris (strain AG1-IB / isolate 7/3/14) TaxID=1108050 RepID=A0A0B7FLI7_THACB|nr:hypothetical protein RSOLAG1IB_12141 [Rhizoctonia solani AG-1 IB]
MESTLTTEQILIAKYTANPRITEFRDANANRFEFNSKGKIQTYRISLDGTNHQDGLGFDRDHVLNVIEHAVYAESQEGKVKGLLKVEDKNGQLVDRYSTYPHVFQNREEFQFRLYKDDDGPLYEYPIFPMANTFFGPLEGFYMSPGAYRVVYTLKREDTGTYMGYLQGIIGHKNIPIQDMSQKIGEQVAEGQDNSGENLKPAPFVLCPQFDRHCDSDGRPKGTATTYTSPNWDGSGGKWEIGKTIPKGTKK